MSVDDHVFKVLVLGDAGCGKSSFIKRYVSDIFETHHTSTIGMDFFLKIIKIPPQDTVRVQLWDIAGQERFGALSRVYYSGAVGAILLYDVTRPRTFENVKNWKEEIDSKVVLANGAAIPVVLAAHKIDLVDGFPSPEQEAKLNTFCREQNLIGWFGTSAKEKINLETTCVHLVSSILKDKAALMEPERDDPAILSLPAPEASTPRPSRMQPIRSEYSCCS